MRAAKSPAFEDFVLARSAALLRTAFLLTGDRGHAEDLLQSALERLARHWNRMDGDPEGWVRRTMANLATDRWRRRAARPQEFTLSAQSSDRVDTADFVAAYEDRELLARLLRSLSPRQRAVLVLRYFEDLSEADTAAVLGCSTGTVKSTASRALAQLRDHLPITTTDRSQR